MLKLKLKTKTGNNNSKEKSVSVDPALIGNLSIEEKVAEDADSYVPLSLEDFEESESGDAKEDAADGAKLQFI